MMLEGSYTTQSLETTIPNGKYTSDPVTIGINAAAFDGVGTFLLPIQIESVSPEVPINESLRTPICASTAPTSANPFPMIDRSGWSIAAFSSEESEPQADYPELPRQRKGRVGNRRLALQLLGHAMAQRQARSAALGG